MAKGAKSGVSFGDYIRKKQEEEEQKKKGVSTNSSKEDSAPAKNKSGKTFGEYVYENETSKDVDSSYVSKWFNDASSTIKSYQDYMSKNEGKYNTEYGGEYTSKIQELLDSSEKVSAFLNYNKDKIDDYDSLSTTFGSLSNYLRSANSSINKTSGYYSKFETEGDYHGYIMTKTGDKTDIDSVKARQNSYSSITSRIAEIDKELDNWGDKYGYEKDHPASYTPYGGIAPNYTYKVANKEEYDKLVAERDRLHAYLNQYDRDGKEKDTYFAEYGTKSDYEEKSSNRDFGNSSKDDYDEFDTKAYGGYISYYDGSPSTKVEGLFDYNVAPEDAMEHMGVELSINDPLGFYFDTLGRYAEEDETSYYSPKERIAGAEHNAILMQGDNAHWSNLTEDETQMYYYLLNDQGKDSAMAFLKGMESELGYRETEEYKEYLEEASFGEYVFANALSIPANVVGGAVALIDEGASMVRGEDPNFYNTAHSLKNFADTTRSVTANELNELTGASDSDWLTWGDAYQGIMSAADSIVGATVFGGGYTYLMGTGAASSEAKELYESGASKGQIIAGSLLAGAAEAFFEHFSIGYYLDEVVGKPSKNGWKWVYKTLLASGIEASEELCTTLANYVSDAAVRGNTSDWETIINKYKKQGLTDGQAIWNAIKSVGGEALHDAAVGAISGGFMGGAGGAVRSVAYASEYNDAMEAYGKQIIDAGGVDTLKTLALDMAGEQKGIANLADKVALKSNANKVSKADTTTKRGAKAVGVLADTMDSTRVKQNKADFVKSLQANGVDKAKAKQYADILFEMNEEYFAGKDVFTLGTEEQWKKITGDENAYSVLREVVTDMDSSVNTRNYQHRLARQGLKMTEDGKIALSDHNQQKVNEVLKKSFDKQSEGIKAKVNEDGNAKVVSTDTEVTLNGIDHIETKKNDEGKKVKVAYLKTVDADGNESVVEWGDVEFGSRNDAVLYETFVGMDIDPAYFDAFVKNFNETDYDASIGEVAMQYAQGFRNAFRYGWANMETEMNEDMFVSKLTESVRNTAYTLGKESIESKIDAEQKSLDTAVAERKASGKGKVRTQGELHMADTIKTKPKKSFTKAQNAGIGLAKRLTNIGYDVYLFESHKDENGNWVDENGNEADNGFYRADDGSIHIDINAGRGDVSLMAYTISHELVHSMRQYSPREFKVLADLLYKWYGKKGLSINELVERKMDELDCDWDTAYEEVIADSCESFLTDSNIADRIIELQQTDKKTWEVIRDKVLDFLKWMKSLFVDIDPDSVEGRFVRQYKDEIDHLYDAFYNALASASETHQWVGSIAEAKTNEETLATAGITVDADTGSAVMNSVRYAPKTQAEIDKVAKALSESMGVSIEKAKAWVKSETSLTSIILDPSNAMFLDYEADDRYEAIKKNAEYPQGTVDFSNLCKKRREFTALLDKLQKEHPNRIITAEEMEKIRQILIEENVEVACGLCYVEERRQLLGEIAQGFIDGYKNGTLKANIAKELDGNDSYVPTIYDLITYDGYRALTTEHPSIAEAFKKFNNARGMQAGRLIEGIAEYKRDILNWSQKKVDFVNSVGGLRVFSFSDFEATHLIDLVQVVQDCAVKGVMIQAYTKVPAFANAVKDTNMKVNRSLIAKGTGIKYENGRMVLDLDPVEGIDINDKDFFDSTHSKNVGNVLVGMSNEQIRLAMKTPFVDYIIPFHTSLKGEILGAKKIDHWDNYKNFQTDKEFHPEKVTYKKDGSIKSDGWVVAENQINVYVDVIQAAEAEGKPIKNKVDFVNKFLAVAKEKGLKPRFWQFLDVDANGEYTYTEGYHKFLVDFKLFDQQGNILPQEPVVPEFDDALNARILNEYVEGKKTPAPRDAVYDRLEREVINGDVKKSSRKTGHSAEKVYNDKNTTKEGLIRGESRQETRGAFLRRANETVLEVGQRGESRYGYRRTSPANVTERSRQVEEELKRLSIPSVVYDVLEVNRSGVSSLVTSEATTIPGDVVFINNALTRSPQEVAGHEAFHFWRTSNERTAYIGVLENNIIFSSNEYASFISEIEEGYSINDAEIGSKQWNKLMEEVFAYISGFIHSGNNVDLVMPFIRDFSEVESAWNALVNSRSQDVGNANPTKDPDIRYSKRQKAPTFYSYMGVVVDGVKQEKLGAASVINMLKGKGVKDEEIKWSGIETWLEGKKSVTKAELQEFIAGSQLQIDEDTLDNKDRPYTENQQKRLDEYEAKRDEVAKRLADEWKKVTGDEFPIRNAGAGLESAVTNAIIDANLAKKNASFEGRLLKKLRKDLYEVIKRNDDFGFDSAKDALRSIHRHRRDFIPHYEMSTSDKAVIVKYCNALNEYNELPNSISDEDTDKLRSIALEADPWNRKIMEVKHEHNEEEATYMTKWGQYSLKGGKDYREVLFRVPDSTYSNSAMYAHWGARRGVLAHARIQDFVDTDGNRMLFIEELQSDWHNEGHKSGYRDPSVEDKHTVSKKMEKFREEFFESSVAKMFEEKISAVGYEGAGVSMMLNYLLDETDYTLDVLRRKGVSFTNSEKSEIDRYVREYGELSKQWEDAPGDLTAPDAPFKETYHEFVLKRLIRMAADEGYDSIGWTPADTQMERWNPKRKTNREMGIEDAKNPDAIAFEDGYRIEYDQDIPKFLRKYGKKWGAEVGKTTIPSIDTNDNKVWSMPITDSMKDSVLYEGQVMYQRRGTGTSNRSLLANALESATQHESEAKRLAEYKAKIDLINAEEQKLYEARKRIAELSFAKGPKDTVAIKNLQDTATRIANRINTYDKQLLNLEATAPLKALLEREKAMARKEEKQRTAEALAKYREKSAETLREVMNRNTESRKMGVESRKRTAVRNKIRGVVRDLNGLLNRGTKERNVKTDMQETVGSALKLANVIFNDDITNEDIVLMGSTMATEEEQKLLDQYKALIEKRDSSTADESLKAINKISTLNSKLSDLFKRERARLNQAKVSEAVDELAKAYAGLKNSDKDYVRVYYDEAVYQRLTSLSDSLGGTVMKDMSLDQLEEVYDAYKMIRHIVRESNSLFRMGKTQDLAKTVTAVHEEILSYYKERKNDPRAGVKKIADILSGFAWNEMKPLTAFETLGSDAYTELFWDAIKAESEWAKWMEESKVFLDEQRKKFGYKSWKMEDAHEFTLPDGKVFRLTLQDMMSIYAYSKRDQAQEHMTIGGFQFDKNNAYKDKGGKKRVRLGDLYVTDWTTIGNIIGELTDEQRQYVDAVQSYLTDMGKRGNEVSEILYGIGIFNESAYFPLMSAKDYRSSVEEALSNTQTQVSLKNTGMAKQTVPHANNPIILQGFDDVAIGHIDKMAKYCTHVLAIENLRRVFDSVSADDNGGYVSTKAVIEKVFGESAKKYFDQYITDLNGGVFMDGAESPTMAMFSKFKGTAVGASLSVVVQQPMAVIRAMDVINPKHFILGKAGKAETNRLYDEIKKYAPVATIKEMGGFDVGSSRTAREYLGMRTDKGVQRAVDEVNKAAMWGAGEADKLGWGIIWKAVKREVASEKKLKQGTEEFYEACGERFTEVIVRSQVYDSVNSRSGYMRSKRELVKFATSFMGEPTTVVNEAYLAMLNVSRANGKQEKAKALGKLGRTMGVLLTSTLLTTVAKSFIYAMRDDEDDEALMERWANQFADNLKSDLNLFSMLPFARDIVSIFEGWDVERPDMTLVANVITSAKRLLDRDDEDHFTNWDEALTFIGDTANLFGLPVKNVIRDGRGIINFFKDIFDDVKPTDMGGAFVRGITGEDKYKTDALYDAIVSGDTGRADVIKKGYKDDKAVESAIRKGLRENDPRIKEAAKARYEGNITEYMRIVREIKAEGHFSQDTIVASINAEINQLKPDKESASNSPAVVTVADYYNAILSGQTSTANSIKSELVAEKIAEGNTKAEAESSVESGFVNQVKTAYMDGTMGKTRAVGLIESYGGEDTDGEKKIKEWDFESATGYSWGQRDNAYRLGKVSRDRLISYFEDIEGKTKDEAVNEVQVIEFREDYPEYSDVSSDAIKKFYNPIKGMDYSIEDTGMRIDVYSEYYLQAKDCDGVDSNNDGRADSGSKKAEIMQVIHSLPITAQQKDALYYLNGWSAKTLYEAPWR